MMPLRVCIVDDEALARARLARLLASHEDVLIVGEFESGRDWLDAAPACDLVLLDIEMPELDGFATLAQAEATRQIVFVTAHEDYAVRAFDAAASDYLLKPVSAARLATMLDRVRVRHAAGGATAAPHMLTLPLGRERRRVPAHAIDCVVAQANYVEFRSGGRTFVERKTLAQVEAQLDRDAFARVHRSILLRVDAVESIVALPSGRYRLRLRDGQVLDSGRSYRDEVRRRFGLAS